MPQIPGVVIQVLKFFGEMREKLLEPLTCFFSATASLYRCVIV